MKEIFNENIDGCIRVMLHTEEKAYNGITNFIKKIPYNVKNEIKSIMSKYEKANISKDNPDTFKFRDNDSMWIFKYGDGNFELSNQSLINKGEKTLLSVFDFNEAPYNIVDGVLDKSCSELVGIFRTEEPKLLNTETRGYEYDFWIETSLFLRKIYLVTEIIKIKDGYMVENAFGKESIERKSSLNLSKCWSKERLAKIKESIVEDRAEDELLEK